MRFRLLSSILSEGRNTIMRNLVIGLAGIPALVVCGVLVFGVFVSGQEGARHDPPPPTDKGASWTVAEMTAAANELTGKKSATHRYFGAKAYNMEVRRLAGPQPILQHAKKSDFMVIQDGEGTFMSGGELVNGKALGED